MSTEHGEHRVRIPQTWEKAGRKLEKERDRREKRRFLDHHPLAQASEASNYWYLARTRHCYDDAGHSAGVFTSAYANLEPAMREALDPLFPHRPSVHIPQGSDLAWLVYLTCLWMSRSAREQIIAALRELIVDRFGEDRVPIIHDQFVCISSPEEPPF